MGGRSQASQTCAHCRDSTAPAVKVSPYKRCSPLGNYPPVLHHCGGHCDHCWLSASVPLSPPIPHPPLPTHAAQVTYSPDMGEVQEYFLGSGGLINLYCSLTGGSMPGTTEAVAQVSVFVGLVWEQWDCRHGAKRHL